MNVLIVGGGLAGVRCAEALRQAGWRGTITLVGEEAHLPYERPPLSKGVLLGTQAAQSVTVLERVVLDRMSIRLRLGVRAVEIDRRGHALVLADGDRLPYDQLVLATGIRPRRLEHYDVPGRLLYLRTLDDALTLKTALRPACRVLVVGAGYLGLECAASARQMGCEAFVVERAPSALYRAIATQVGDYIVELHRKHGVHIEAGCQVTGIRLRESGAGHVMHVTLSNGLEREADFVIAAAGSIPNSELAEAAGLEVRDGVVVDEFGRTSDPDIYAIGDVARHYSPILGREIRLESWQNAQRHAVAVARVIAGGSEPYAEVPWFWSDQYDMNLQIIGHPVRWDRIVLRGERRAGRFTALYLDEGRVVAANMVNNGRDTRAARELVSRGVHVDAASAGNVGIPLQSLLERGHATQPTP